MSGDRWEIGTTEDCISWRGALLHGADLAEWLAPWADCINPSLGDDDEADAALAALVAAVSDAALLAQIRQAVDAWFADDDANDRAAIHAIAALLGEQ